MLLLTWNEGPKEKDTDLPSRVLVVLGLGKSIKEGPLSSTSYPLTYAITRGDLVDTKIITWFISLSCGLVWTVDTTITKTIVQTVMNSGQEVTSVVVTRLIKSSSAQFITKDIVICSCVEFSQNTILNFAQLNEVLVIVIISLLLKCGTNLKSVAPGASYSC